MDDVLSRLGEAQRMNRDGIKQADVQPVGESCGHTPAAHTPLRPLMLTHLHPHGL